MGKFFVPLKSLLSALCIYPSLISLVVSVDVKHHVYFLLCITEFRSCVKVEVAVLGCPS